MGEPGSIVIVDYEMGNLNSVKKQFNRLNESVLISSEPRVIASATKLVLPGVGHFGKAMESLGARNLIAPLREAALERKVPVLGICLGFQIMARTSEEGNVAGLGWFDAEVVRFRVNDALHFKIPHMGWNQVSIKKPSPLMRGIAPESEFYFVHSYCMKTDNPDDVLSETTYETPFVSAIERGNIFGVQYHPEKSHASGAQLLKNFVDL
jgi:imidazole glycerol-phosphate synthase subunit HisH